MLHKIEQWIDQTNLEYQGQRISCSKFFDDFSGFYSLEFLQQAYFVVVDTIPKPNFPELRQMGLGNFIDMEVHGITYKNTYYILPHLASNLRLHFHELVHVAQWGYLGAIPFIERYITEIKTVGYGEAPLEKMAYGFDSHFTNGGEKIDVPNYVAQKI
ncbi:hypothetical protein HNR62_001545 [Oceanisphaera litoralis]|uniref:hypothetical protein n=1 Tax=Oceanisphaera litoralis TaxID=225144 RepID=UPI00195EDF6C|nr:hypothetical protein [Oceanisphaera litoralis]MBM7455673.1 hypothetical protein [Oceanisphaera litoralis]